MERRIEPLMAKDSALTRRLACPHTAAVCQMLPELIERA